MEMNSLIQPILKDEKESKSIYKKWIDFDERTAEDKIIVSLYSGGEHKCDYCGENKEYPYINYDKNLSKMICSICKKKEELKKIIEKPDAYLSNYNVPEKFLDKSFDNFENNPTLIEKLKEYFQIRPLGSLMLIGKVGTGKTHLAVSIMRELIIKRANQLLKNIDSNDIDSANLSMLFIPVPEILLEIRSTFNSNYNISEKEIISKYAKIHYLILDDLGAEKTTDWSITTLYIILDRRYRNNKPTLITTNLNLKEIENNLGSRIASRLSESLIVPINMLDFRKKR